MDKFSLGERAFGTLLTWFQAHQSGVNCLKVMLRGREVRVVSGGDDNGIFLAHFGLSDTLVPQDAKVFKYPGAHGSSIKGIDFLNETTFVTASTDQRLNFWYFNSASNTLVLANSYLAEVWDVAGLALFNDESRNKLTVTVIGNGSLEFESV